MTINPDLQRFMAARMKARTIELASSHVSLISHPREIAEVIREAAANSRAPSGRRRPKGSARSFRTPRVP
jgi:hypothetical protein